MTLSPLIPPRPCSRSPGLWRLLAVPLLLVALAIFLEYSGLDLKITGAFYDSASGTWPHKQSFWIENVLYNQENYLTYAFYAAVLTALMLTLVVPAWSRWRRVLLFLAVASASGPLVVGIMKALTYIHVPWHLDMFGGKYPYLRLFDPAPLGLPVGHAFPGGHSSGAFGWISLFFLMRAAGNPWSYRALAAVVVAGALFSLTQVMRGAHFVSHDVFSLAICWSAALVWTWIFFPSTVRESEARTSPDSRLRPK